MSSFQTAYSPLVARSGAYLPLLRFSWQAKLNSYLNQLVMDFLSLRKSIVTKLAQIDTKEIHSVRNIDKYIKSASYLKEATS